MARVFLDTNIFIDLVEDRGDQKLIQDLDRHRVYISPLSTHILFYVEKMNVPDQEVFDLISQFVIVDLTSKIHNNSLEGPTNDLEDNIQLHSASEAGCDYFLTNDKKLLKLNFFGKTRITDRLSPPLTKP